MLIFGLPLGRNNPQINQVRSINVARSTVALKVARHVPFQKVVAQGGWVCHQSFGKRMCIASGTQNAGNSVCNTFTVAIIGSQSRSSTVINQSS